jgi:hypothetical protein
MPEQPLTDQISKFFEDYHRTFNGADGASIAMFYHVPSVTLRGDGSTHCFRSREELASFFQGVAEGYNREGNAGGGGFYNLAVQPIGGRSALATMDWQLMRADGSLFRQWRQSYNLLRADGRWQIFVATFHVEG